jgi:hypothetical protein
MEDEQACVRFCVGESVMKMIAVTISLLGLMFTLVGCEEEEHEHHHRGGAYEGSYPGGYGHGYYYPEHEHNIWHHDRD